MRTTCFKQPWAVYVLAFGWAIAACGGDSGSGNQEDAGPGDLDAAADVSNAGGTSGSGGRGSGGNGLGGVAGIPGQGGQAGVAADAGIDASPDGVVSVKMLVAVSLTPANVSIAKGTTQQLVATGTFSDSTTSDISNQVTWVSSDPGVATIAGGLATAVAVGSTTITASLNGKAGSTTFTVTAAVLEAISLEPASPVLPQGLTQQFAAIGTFSDTSW